VNWARASSIEFAPALHNLVLDGGAEMPVAVGLGAGLDEDVFAHVHIPEAMMRTLHSFDGTFGAFWHNDHEINVTVFMGRAPGVRAEEIDFLRLKFLFQPFNRFVQKAGLNRLHDIKITSWVSPVVTTSPNMGGLKIPTRVLSEFADGLKTLSFLWYDWFFCVVL